MKSIKLTALQKDERTVVYVGDVAVGNGFCVIAGPGVALSSAPGR